MKLCLFDLDQTLVKSNDWDEWRPQARYYSRQECLKKIQDTSVCNVENRICLTSEHLQEISASNPGIRFGVVSRAPRAYVETVLETFFPKMKWSVIVAYEDVSYVKPDPSGIELAKKLCGLEDAGVDEVIYVGDDVSDMEAALRAGCTAVLALWWKKLSKIYPVDLHFADWSVDTPQALVRTLNNRDEANVPALEVMLQGRKSSLCQEFRIARRDNLVKEKSHAIYTAGRYFSKAHFPARFENHALTHSILANKDQDGQFFPIEWFSTLENFVLKQVCPWHSAVILTCVPCRPGRVARMENFLYAFERYMKERHELAIFVHDRLFYYEDGVQSNHAKGFGREERFDNVKNHLRVSDSKTLLSFTHVVIIDDVVTTGASLITARELLQKEHVTNRVWTFAFAENVYFEQKRTYGSGVSTATHTRWLNRKTMSLRDVNFELAGLRTPSDVALGYA